MPPIEKLGLINSLESGQACDCFNQLRTGKVQVLVAHLCLTLGDPMDCNPPGSSVRGIFQARIWERVAISSCRVSPADSVSNFEHFVGIKLNSTVAYGAVRKRGLSNKPGGER